MHNTSQTSLPRSCMTDSTICGTYMIRNGECPLGPEITGCPLLNRYRDLLKETDRSYILDQDVHQTKSWMGWILPHFLHYVKTFTHTPRSWKNKKVLKESNRVSILRIFQFGGAAREPIVVATPSMICQMNNFKREDRSQVSVNDEDYIVYEKIGNTKESKGGLKATKPSLPSTPSKPSQLHPEVN